MTKYKPTKKPTKADSRPTNFLLGRPPGPLKGRLSNLLPKRLERRRVWTLSSNQHRCCSSNYGTHQERDNHPQVLHTNNAQSRQYNIKPHPTNRVGGSVSTRKY